MRAASARLAGSSSHRQASISALISAFSVLGLLAAQDSVVPSDLALRNEAINGPVPYRVVPDISMDADPQTGMLIGLTEAFSDGTYYDQYKEGGTSLASPFWSAIITDRDSFTGQRTGNINPLVYTLFNLAPAMYFHDITGIGPDQKAATNNGLFPTTPGYDMATGVGTPEMTAFITRSGP